jgi:hypothetical protein
MKLQKFSIGMILIVSVLAIMSICDIGQAEPDFSKMPAPELIADKVLQDLDTNDDRMLQINELETHPKMVEDFALIDKNHDGFAERNELVSFLRKMKRGKQLPPAEM